MHSDLSYDLGLTGGKKMSPNCRQQGAFICILEHIKKPENQRNSLIFRLLSGVGRDRTADTRIFSPLLYRLSYRTIQSHFRSGLQI